MQSKAKWLVICLAAILLGIGIVLVSKSYLKKDQTGADTDISTPGANAQNKDTTQDNSKPNQPVSDNALDDLLKTNKNNARSGSSERDLGLEIAKGQCAGYAVWSNQKRVSNDELQAALGFHPYTFATGPIILRKAAQNEITDSRNPIEDKLRMLILGAYWEKETVARLKEILNEPWNHMNIDYLWNLPPEGPVKSYKVKLFAYVAANYEEFSDAIKGYFDSEYGKILDIEEKSLRSAAGSWAIMVNALDDFGSAELIKTPKFWEVIAKSSLNISGFRLFRKFTDKEVLEELKKIEETCNWPETERVRWQHLRNSIKDIESLHRFPMLKFIEDEYDCRNLVERADRLVRGTEENRFNYIKEEVMKEAEELAKRANNEQYNKEDRKKWAEQAQKIKDGLKQLEETGSLE